MKQTMKSYVSLIFSGLSVFLYFMKLSNSANTLINTNNGDVMCIDIKDINAGGQGHMINTGAGGF